MNQYSQKIGRIFDSNVSFPLTPALSLGERVRRFSVIEAIVSVGFFIIWRMILPLPQGEGRGEGEGHVESPLRFYERDVPRKSIFV